MMVVILKDGGELKESKRMYNHQSWNLKRKITEEGSFLDLYLKVSDRQLSTKLFDKRGDFSFLNCKSDFFVIIFHFFIFFAFFIFFSI